MAVRDSARDDIELVRRAQAGDQNAFTELFQRLHQPVLNYVYRMLGDREAAQDITQDAFVRAHLNLGQLGPPYDFKSWIYRIAGNLALNLIKRERRFVDDEELESMASPGSPKRPSELEAQREELRQAVWNSLDDIPSVYRQALILREFNQLSYKEIAQALERSYDNTRQIIHRARRRFADAHIGRKMIAEGPYRCGILGDLLTAHRDRELKAEEHLAVEEHIGTCADCQATQKDLRKASALLALIPPIFPSKAWAATVLEEIARQSPTPSQVEIKSRAGDASEAAIRQRAPGDLPGSSKRVSRAKSMSKSLVGLLVIAGGAGLGLIVVAGALALSMIRSSLPVPMSTPTAIPSMAPSQLLPSAAPSNIPALPDTGESVVVSDTPTSVITTTITLEPIIVTTPPPSITPSPTKIHSPTPSLTPTPTKTHTLTLPPPPSPPEAPTKLVISERTCDAKLYQVTLSWVDNAMNEEGYRVYRDGKLIATLGKNATSYTDNPPGSGPYTYGVEAFNADGASGRPTVKEEGCLF